MAEAPDGRSDAKRKLLERRLRGDTPAEALPDLRPGQREARPALSFAQQRLWFLDQLIPDNPFYNIAVAHRLVGELDVAALERALCAIVARHESLRTTFSVVDGRPVQVVGPPGSFALEVTNLSSYLSDPSSGPVADHAVVRKAVEPFDLERGPLVRASLLRLAAQEHILLLTIHHVAADGWSLGLLTRELETLYRAFRAGRPSPLPPLRLQYADFSTWQRRWLNGERLERQLAYWREQLAGSPPALELPADRPRPPVPTYRGRSRRFRVPLALAETVRACGRAHDATPFMTLLAAFQALLARYTGSDDIVVGSPIAGRTRPELEELVGFFVNTLVLRTNCGGDPNFGDLLGRVREVCLGAYSHQEVPFERLVEELAPERTLSHMTLFQVMFVLQNTPEVELRLDGVDVQPVEFDVGIAKADLAMHLVEDADGLAGELFYATDLFESATADRLIDHFLVLLEAAVSQPSCPISRLPLLTERERHRIVVEWNDTAHPSPDVTIPELVAAAAERDPNKIAIVCGPRTMSYGELERSANQLAHHLQAVGAGRETLVGVSLERSPELVVALLGILRSGAAYVPLDPALPTERLAFMLSDTAVAAVVTQAALVPRLPAGHHTTVLLDEDRDKIGGRPTGAPPNGPIPDDLAYVLYTSGSTGRPKGVMIEQRGVVNHLCALVRDCELSEQDTVLQLPSISFHPSVRDIFGTLCAGGRLVLVDERDARDPAALLTEMHARGVTALLSGVPSLLTALVAEAEQRWSSMPALRLVVVCGEALRVTDARRLTQRFGCCVLNHFGPTESIMAATSHWFGEQDEGHSEILAGRPIANAEVYVLDRRGQPVPIGVPGEVHIGGLSLARGYLNRPDLTAERFVAHPFRSVPRSRVYRSGDLARYLTDGTLQFLGRSDLQVKVRGHRVEPAEVEVALMRHPAVWAVAVVPTDDGSGRLRLVAYVAAKAGMVLQAPELRAHLRTTLPDYMIPAVFVALDALPLGPSGKLDRDALSIPEATRRALDAVFVAPRTDVEQRLATLFAEVLGLDAVGIRDDFFELGGHSLLAVELFARIESVLQIRLPLAQLFEEATVEALAVAVDRERHKPAPWSSMVPIRTRGSKLPLFLGPDLQGHLLPYRNLVAHLPADQPVYGLQSVGLDGRRAPLTTVPALAAELLREVREVQPSGPYLLAGYCFGGVVAVEMAHQLEQAGERVALLALFDHPTYERLAAPAPALRRDRARLAELPTFRAKARFVGGRLRAVTDRLRNWLAPTGEEEHGALWWAAHDLSVRVGRPLPRRLRDMTAVNRRALRAYVPPQTRCEVTLLTTYDDATDGWFGDADRWHSIVARGRVERVMSPGITHLTLTDEPHVGVLASILTKCITEADAVAPVLPPALQAATAWASGGTRNRG